MNPEMSNQGQWAKGPKVKQPVSVKESIALTFCVALGKAKELTEEKRAHR